MCKVVKLKTIWLIMYATAPGRLLYGTNCNHTKYSAQRWQAREHTKLMVCVICVADADVALQLAAIYSTRVGGTHLRGVCWCPDCPRWWCSPSGTERRPPSRWQGGCRAYRRGRCRRCTTCCTGEKEEKTEIEEKERANSYFSNSPRNNPSTP